MRATWIAGLAVVIMALAAGAQEPADFEALVLQLGDDAFERREQAQAALLAAGQAAGPALLRHRDHADLEVRQRVKRVIESLGILSDADRARLDAAIVRLLDGPAGEREAAVRDALTIGPTGRAALAAALLAPKESCDGRWTHRRGWSAEPSRGTRNPAGAPRELDDAGATAEPTRLATEGRSG